MTWYIVKGGGDKRRNPTLALHAFLIGRFKDRPSWFLSDQGSSPPLELEAPDLATLKRQALAAGRYWTGAPPSTFFFAGRGGVMVENPIGLFHVYETSTVSAANLNVTDIDEADSAGGKLEKSARRFSHAWLRLSTSSSSNPRPLKVY